MVALLDDRVCFESDACAALAGAEGDHRYSVQAITDSSGSVVERYAYTPYGEMVVLDAAGAPKVDPVSGDALDPIQPYGYTGRRYDAEIGLWYFRARYFDAELGRFVSRDPLGYVDGMSMYRGYFVPTAMDPSGWFSCDEDCSKYNGSGVRACNRYKSRHCTNSLTVGMPPIKWGLGFVGDASWYSPPLFGGPGLFVKTKGEVIEGKCCDKDGKRTSYQKVNWSLTAGIHYGSPYLNVRIGSPVRLDLARCPDAQDTKCLGILTFSARLGPFGGSCTYAWGQGFSCGGSLTVTASNGSFWSPRITAGGGVQCSAVAVGGTVL
jgi:RHS repeat-associated protein